MKRQWKGEVESMQKSVAIKIEGAKLRQLLEETLYHAVDRVVRNMVDEIGLELIPDYERIERASYKGSVVVADYGETEYIITLSDPITIVWRDYGDPNREPHDLPVRVVEVKGEPRWSETKELIDSALASIRSGCEAFVSELLKTAGIAVPKGLVDVQFGLDDEWNFFKIHAKYDTAIVEIEFEESNMWKDEATVLINVINK